MVNTAVRKKPGVALGWCAAAVASSAMLACGCASCRPSAYPQHSSTFYVQAGLCSSTILLDGRGGIWTESGCEGRSSGWKRVRKASEEQQRQIRAAFEALRGTPQGEFCDGGVYAIESGPKGGERWYVCVRIDVPVGEASELPPAFQAIDEAFREP